MNSEKFLEGLNEEQTLAVKTTEGAVRLIAGAGSGKTHTLTRRVAYIAASKNIDPKRILSLTFTNKAATEMRSRTAKLLDRPEEDFYMSTFHSLALDIIKRDCDTVFGWKKLRIAQLSAGILVPMFFNKYTYLLDGYSDDDKRKIKEYLVEKVNKALKYYNYSEWLTSNYKSKPLATTADFIDAMEKDKEYSKIYSSVKQGIKKETDAKKIEALYKKYEDSIVDKSVLKPINSWVESVIQLKRETCTFDDLINLALYMLKEYPTILEYWSNQFDYIQVDEFQDTDSKQLEMIQLLYQRHGNLFVVGDPDQSIYIFRGAEPSLFSNLDDYIPNLTTIFMITNYRSSSEIVDVSNEVIKLNKNRIEKTCESKVGKGSKVKVLTPDGVKSLAQVEYDEISDLLKNGVNYNDIAILYRNVNDTETKELQNILESNGIPFISTLVIKDVYNEATLNICKYKHSADISHLIAAAELFVNGNDIHSKGLVDIEDFKKVALDADSIFGLFNKIKCKYDSRKKVPTPVKDYQRFLDNASAIKQGIEDTLNAWNNISNTDKDKKCVVNALDIDVEVEDGDGIKIMTMHKSKGLEFPYVFVNSLNKKMFDSVLDGVEEEEEKARLAYVAYSRAKKQLYLGCNDIQDMHGVLGQISNMPELECANKVIEDNFKKQKDASVSDYTGILDRKSKITYYKLYYSDNLVGYRCVMSVDGEVVGYQANISDLERLNCVPKECTFLVTVSKKPIILHKNQNGKLKSNDEINATMRVKNLVNDSDILEVFKGSNTGFEKDVKDIDKLRDLISKVQKSESPFEKYLELLEKRKSKQNEKAVNSVENINGNETVKQNLKLDFAVIKNSNDNSVIGVRVKQGDKVKDISISEATQKGIKYSDCSKIIYEDRKINVSYMEYKNVNDNNKYLNAIYCRIESVDLPNGTCTVLDLNSLKESVLNIAELVDLVGKHKIYIKNPSALTQWKNWRN